MTLSPTHPLRVAAAVIRRRAGDGGADELLLTQRPPGGVLGLQWEFPGGKIEPGESAERALEREIEEELGVRANAKRVVDTARHTYDHGVSVEIVFIECEIEAAEFRPSAAVHRVRWAKARDIDLDELLEADRAFVRRLRETG
ncbi:MAG TPA: (deoxy)nucleoside triphosphate pyrophosphohydrolase [Candidatus Udaeobacter sp.]|jgi:8-oxo-dGTP diphosphatase|nr:(deoxy)nucleoside triphosphate pyrophosphohydrolase [Candidatus Udaeobacter sp.]